MPKLDNEMVKNSRQSLVLMTPLAATHVDPISSPSTSPMNCVLRIPSLMHQATPPSPMSKMVTRQ